MQKWYKWSFADGWKDQINSALPFYGDPDKVVGEWGGVDGESTKLHILRMPSSISYLMEK